MATKHIKKTTQTADERRMAKKLAKEQAIEDGDIVLSETDLLKRSMFPVQVVLACPTRDPCTQFIVATCCCLHRTTCSRRTTR
jgi:hypothetical protein